jgi:hypothetical protein
MAAVSFATAACGRGPVKPEECTHMLERYVDLTIDADPQLASLPKAQLDAARAIKRAIRETESRVHKVQEQCEKEIRRREYECAMAAKTPNDWEACID